MKKYGGIVVALMLTLCGLPAAVWAQQDARTLGSRQTETSEFYLLGFVGEGGSRQGILGWQGLVFLVREGDTVLGTYRVERLGDDVATLRDGPREVRAPFRPKQPDVVALQPSAPAPVMVSPMAPPPVMQPMDQPSAAPIPPGMIAAPGVGALPAPSSGMGGSAGSIAQTQEDNPFVKALRERAQQSPSSASSDNPFASGTQPGSSTSAPGDNPFLRALRERGSAPPSTQDNPFLRALRERGY